MKENLVARWRTVSLLVFWSLFWAVSQASARAESPAQTVAVSTAGADAVALQKDDDDQASVFVLKCAGCHAIGGAKLSAPNLAHVAAWKRSDLLPAIKRMEKNVGPLSDGEVEQHANFLQSANADARLLAERERVAKKLMAKMEPPSAAEGGRLFHGEKRLRHGGPACVACHQAKAGGGILGPKLGDSVVRMGDMSFVSFVENGNSPVMNPVYKRHPVTKQEALHIAAYAKNPGAEERDLPVGMYGALGATVFLTGMAFYARGRKDSTRVRLIRNVTRSRDT